MADATTISVLIRARDEASAKLQQVEGRMGKLGQSFERHRRGIGMAAAGIGAAIVGIGLLSVKSSMDQQVGINQLDVALQNVGTSYEKNKAQIEAVISAQQNKTNFGDEVQRVALQKLVQVTGDYDLSMQAMIPLMDMAAATGMKLEGASVLVARAISGEETALKRYGIALETGAGPQAVMNALMEKFAGQAEAAADPMTQLKNRMGDVLQVLGDALLPVLETLLPMIEKAARRVIEWAEAHPTLTKVLALVATAIGAILLVLGPLILLLPTIVAGVGLLSVAFVKLNLSMGVVTLAILAIAAVIAAGILVYKNWDAIMQKLQDNWKIILPILAMALGPIGLITAAIAGGILIWKNWDVVVQTVKEALGDFAKFVIDVGIRIAEGAKAMIGWIPGLGGIKEGLDNAIDSMKGMKEGLDDWVDTAGFTAKKTGEAFGEMEDAQMALAIEAQKTETAVVGAADKEARAVQEGAAKMVEAIEEVKLSKVEMYLAAKEAVIQTSLAYGEMEDTLTTNLGNIIIGIDELERVQAEAARNEAARIAETIRLRQRETTAFFDSQNMKLEAMKDAEAARDRSLDRLRESLDETNIQWKDSGSRMEDVIKAWAIVSDISIENVLDRMDDLNVDTGNVKETLAAFTKDTGADFFAWSEDVAEATQKVKDDLKTAADEAIITQQRITDALILDEVKRAAIVSERLAAQQEVFATAVEERDISKEAGSVQRQINLTGLGAGKQTGMGTGRTTIAGAFEAVQNFWSGSLQGAMTDEKLIEKILEAAPDAAWGNVSEGLQATIDNVVSGMAAEQAAGASAAAIEKIEAGLTSRQGGGWASGMTLVGERGPEIVNLPSGSYVNPSGRGGMGVTNQFHFHGAVYGVEQLKEVVVEAVRDHAISGGFSGVFAEA